MSSDETDEDSAYREFYHYYQSVIIASDIEDIMLIAYIVGSRKILSYIRQIMPLGLLGGVVPPFQRYSRISVAGQFIELFDFTMWDYVHNLSACKVTDKFWYTKDFEYNNLLFKIILAEITQRIKKAMV